MKRLEPDPKNKQISIILNDLIDQLAYIIPTINSGDYGKVDPSLIEVNGLYIYRRNGLLAYADGTNWNPGSGAGFYRWHDTSWQRVNEGDTGVGAGDTVVSETSFGQSSSAGSGTQYSRKDHTHGTPTIDGDDLPAMSTTKKGGVPATGSPSGKFLKDDGTWDTAGGGAAGYQPCAGGSMSDLFFNASSSATLSNSYGTMITPIRIIAPMLLESVTVRNNDTTGEHTWNWGLYYDTGSTTLTRIAYGASVDTWTATVGSNRTITANSAPVTINPGIYWLAIQNQHVSTTFKLGYYLPGTLSNPMNMYIASGSALGSTLSVSSVTKQGYQIGARLNGRVFGESSAF